MTEMKLPELSYPRIMLMVTDALVPIAGASEEPMSWAVSGDHPFMQDAKIVAMFRADDGIDVYAIHHDKHRQTVTGMRDHVPQARVRICREQMPFDIFAEEIADAEAEESGDVPDDSSPSEQPHTPEPVVDRAPPSTEALPPPEEPAVEQPAS